MEEKKQPRIKILVACHKADPSIRQDDIYMPIQVGKALHPNIDLGFQCDNTGENISEKNGSYCELTALYWAWKNLKDIDYIGLAHYRRYLKVDIENVIPTLDRNSIILPTPGILPYSNFQLLTDGTTREDSYILIKYLKRYEPAYYKAAVDYLFNSNKFIGCNMFITNYALFNDYCEWLFKVLSDLEEYIKPAPYSRLQRIYGYLAEELLPIYCFKNNLKIHYCSFYGSNKTLKVKILQIRNNFIFKLQNIRKVSSVIIPPATEISYINDNIII